MSWSHRRTASPAASPRAGLLDVWRARARARRRLGELDAHLLKDIGVTPDWRDVEAQKPFWRA